MAINVFGMIRVQGVSSKRGEKKNTRALKVKRV